MYYTYSRVMNHWVEEDENGVRSDVKDDGMAEQGKPTKPEFCIVARVLDLKQE